MVPAKKHDGRCPMDTGSGMSRKFACRIPLFTWSPALHLNDGNVGYSSLDGVIDTMIVVGAIFGL
jgi:hypothetical protein